VENVALCVSRRGSEGVGCRPFVLVGHSFGGLVIKALINETKRRSDSAETNALDKKAIHKAKEFLQNLKGIVFYAVPHSGADAATLLSYFHFVRLSNIIRNLTPFSRRMEKKSVMMQDTVYNKGINIYAFGEGRSTCLNKIIRNLTCFSRRMAKMSLVMQDTFYNKGINIYAFGEGRPTYLNKVCTTSQL